MIGVVLIVLVLVIAIPVGFLMTMSVVAGVLGATVEGEVDAGYEGTEYMALAYSPAPEA